MNDLIDRQADMDSATHDVEHTIERLKALPLECVPVSEPMIDVGRIELIALSLFYDGSKAYVNPKNICAIYKNGHGNTELLFAGGDGGNYMVVKEGVETVAKMIGRAWGGQNGGLD